MKSFFEKLVYITGGSSGIGLELASQLTKHGAHLVLIARNQNKLEAVKKDLEASKLSSNQLIVTISVDVANYEDVKTKMSDAVNTFGAPDILINSAGINKCADYFENISHDVFEEVMRINVNGVRNVTHALYGEMKQKKGHIVILSSAAGLFGMFGYSSYGASKAALIGFAESLRYEAAPSGMVITLVMPPEVDTPMNIEEAKTLPIEGRAMKSMAGFLKPDYVSKVILKAIAKKRFFVIPGRLTQFLYFFHRITNGAASRIVSDLTVRRVLKKAGKGSAF